MNKLYTFLVLALISYKSQSQSLVSSTLLRHYTNSDLQAYFPENELDLYKITYETLDIYGNLDTASGAVTIPSMNCSAGFPIGVYCHGTQFEKQNVPSNRVEIDAGLFVGARGYVGVMPDYIGHGESRGIHPYLHEETEATATLDMITATKELLTQLAKTTNGQIFITGYSQGGHAVMATHKYVEENLLYSQFNILASVPASGPYDISGLTYEGMFADPSYDYPAFLPYLMNAMQMAYGNIYTNVSEVYKAPYDGYIQSWLDGSLTLTALNNFLPQDVDTFMEDSILLSYDNDPNNRIRLALEDNNTFDWNPTRQVKMYYCEADHLVNHENALLADSVMKSNGSMITEAVSGGASNDHFGCVQPSLLGAISLFESLANRCSLASVNELSFNDVNIYPNPSTGIVNIESYDDINEVHVYNSLGSLIYHSKKTFTKQSIDLSSLPNGIYHLTLKNTAGVKGTKRLMIQK